MSIKYFIKMYKKANPKGYCFTNDTMDYWGEYLEEMKVEETEDCYVVITIQHNDDYKHYMYFSKDTLKPDYLKWRIEK